MRFGAEKREVSREQLSMWLDEIRPLGYETIPLFSATEKDFDDGLLWSFAAAFEDVSPTINLYQTAAFLKQDLMLAVGTADEFLPSVAALLLFGRDERIAEMYPRATVVATRVSGENGNLQLVETNQITGNLHNQYEALLRFILRYCDLSKDKPRKNLRLVQSPVAYRKTYHIYAVREAVANMLVHRDLALRDIPTRLVISDDYIEFINPRRTKGFNPPAGRAIRYGVSQRLNPLIASIFGRREYGTSVPRGGLPMILKQSERFAGRRAEIHTANDEFKLKIYGA
jgi:predicted HTH transcriptional regulator